MIHRYIIITVFLVLYLSFLQAQNSSISGRVVDPDSNSIIGANIYLKGTVLGAATNLKGEFSIENVPLGEFELVISVLGYQSKELPISIEASTLYDLGTIKLNPQAMTGEPIIVTARKYAQNLQDVPASVSTMNRLEIHSRNIITVDEALKYIPGLNMNSSQVNIRGSSGYSRGVGSRVIFLLDGVPFLTGDTREINFDVIPTFLIDHIEVLKGAGSALYGSGALGGVINVVTREIEQRPHFYGRAYGGFYAKPSYKDWKWTEDRRYFQGMSMNYSRGFQNLGFRLGTSLDRDDSYRQNDWRKRNSLNGKLQWFPSAFQRLSVSGNYMYQKRGNFLYWENLSHALQPPMDQRDDVVESKRYYLTTHYQHIFSNKRFLNIRGIWFRNKFEDNISSAGGNESVSQNVVGEIQYNSQIGQIFSTSGVEATYNSVESNIFGDHSGTGAAAYFQSEISLFRNLQTTFGARFDYFDIDSVDAEGNLNPKLGIVYKPQNYLALRTSLGLGFRAPSIAEVYTSTTSGGVQVIPNVDLKPEKSRYFEIGMNYYLTKKIVADLAYFYSRYSDLIEGSFLQTGQVQFQNVTRARIQGFEINLNGELFDNFLNFGFGYTYTDPWDLDLQKYLTFRPRHLYYTNTRFDIFQFNLGVDYRYISRYDRIDEKLALVVNDAEERVAAHVVDIRLNSSIFFSGIHARLTFQVKNLLQYNYVDLVGSLAPPRQFLLSIETGL